MAARPTRPVADLLPLGIDPRTIFVSGKGGVGKTTVAAAIALAYRDAGVRTLLVQLGGQQPASVLLSGKEVGYDPVALLPGLHAICIDRDTALKEYARLRLKVKLVADRLVGNPIIDQFAQAAPGLPELLVLGKLWQLSQLQDSRGRAKFEAIIVDSPATGHGLGLLGMAGVIARMFPVGPISAEARQVDAHVRDSARVTTLLVALPEEMPVNETFDLSDQLAEHGVDVAGVLLNGMLPARFSADEIELMASLHESRIDASLDAALTTAAYEQERRDAQVAERARLAERFGDLSLLPWRYTTRLTRSDMQDMARWLTPGGQQRLREREAIPGAVLVDAPPVGAKTTKSGRS